MRQDFHKVLTEDPRRGSRNKFSSIRRSKANAFFDEEFSGGKESMMTQRRRQQKVDRKRFGDHLGPLKRFLDGAVGQNWDELHSQFCRLYDKRGQMNFHVHAHTFDDFVETKTKVIDGKVCIWTRWEGWEPLEEKSYYRRKLYVHPETRLLCTTYKEKEAGWKAKKAADEAASLATRAIYRSAEEHLYFDDGVWMVCTMKDIPPARRELRCPSHITYLEWNKMELSQKEFHGWINWVRPDYSPARRGGHYLPRDKYYDTCKPASRRYLKAHGLVGTAEFVESDETLSARTRAKYR